MMDALIVIILVSALFSGLFAAYLSSRLNRRYTENSLKRDVLRRLVGNLFFWTEEEEGTSVHGEPFIALNEIFVVYADHRKVISALREMHKDLDQPDRLCDNLLNLIKEMVEAAGVPVSSPLNDNLIRKPFTPKRS